MRLSSDKIFNRYAKIMNIADAAAERERLQMLVGMNTPMGEVLANIDSHHACIMNTTKSRFIACIGTQHMSCLLTDFYIPDVGDEDELFSAFMTDWVAYTDAYGLDGFCEMLHDFDVHTEMKFNELFVAWQQLCERNPVYDDNVSANMFAFNTNVGRTTQLANKIVEFTNIFTRVVSYDNVKEFRKCWVACVYTALMQHDYAVLALPYSDYGFWLNVIMNAHTGTDIQRFLYAVPTNLSIEECQKARRRLLCTTNTDRLMHNNVLLTYTDIIYTHRNGVSYSARSTYTFWYLLMIYGLILYLEDSNTTARKFLEAAQLCADAPNHEVNYNGVSIKGFIVGETDTLVIYAVYGHRMHVGYRHRTGTWFVENSLDSLLRSEGTVEEKLTRDLPDIPEKHVLDILQKLREYGVQV